MLKWTALSISSALFFLWVGSTTYLQTNKSVKASNDPIILKESLDSVAGHFGYVWTIKPSGNWSVAEFDANGIKSAHRKGTFDPKRWQHIIHYFVLKNWDNLPEEINPGDALVETRTFSISFGGKTKYLVLTPGNYLEEAEGWLLEIDKGQKIRDFAAIVNMIKSLTAN